MIAYDILGNIHGSQRRTWDFSYQHTDAFFRKSTYEFHGLLAEIRPIASTIFPSFCDHPILGYHPICHSLLIGWLPFRCLLRPGMTALGGGHFWCRHMNQDRNMAFVYHNASQCLHVGYLNLAQNIAIRVQ